MKVANETVVQSASLDKLPEQDFVGSNKERSQPIVTAVLSILAALSLIGGILLCVSLWPEDTGSRYLREPVAYIPSAIALSVGIVESVLFYAFGQIIRYLSSADKNIGATKSLTEEILARIQQKGS